jgi:AraC-like DNA-binding protein
MQSSAEVGGRLAAEQALDAPAWALTAGCPALAPGIVHSHFSVQGEAPQRQLLAWRERVGHIIDVPPSLAELEQPFNASIERYALGELVFTDCRSDAMPLERSLARISTDNVRDFVFHVFLEGGVESVAGFYPRRSGAQPTARILALDMNQPLRMRRGACRVLTLFVPGEVLAANLPDAEAIHGRVIDNATPLTQLLVEHVTALNRQLPNLSASEASSALQTGAQLLIGAFGKQARLSGDARAAVRAAVFGQVRRHIEANLHEPSLTPENLLNMLPLSRPSVYRLFEHEGGLVAYMRNRRLRAAADELLRFPQLAVADICYGLGFNSASDFSRAFRRAYDMAPQELRAQALGRRAGGE